MWRQDESGDNNREIDVRRGVALTIPANTSSQFKNTGREALSALGVTMPQWQDGDAATIEGPWQPNTSRRKRVPPRVPTSEDRTSLFGIDVDFCDPRSP